MSDYLLLFTLGPVQSFIAQARKTQDLFAGSQLLSTLTRQAFELLREKLGKENTELIFPALYDNQGEPVASNPNRIAVNISNKTAPEIAKACELVKQELIKEKFTQAALKELKSYCSLSKVLKTAEEQLDKHLEVYWAAIPFDEESYQENYLKLEKYLAGTKNTREFEQMREKGRKCNVDGIRNALFVRHNVDENGNELDKHPNYVQDDYCKISSKEDRLLPGEGLSAVSMYKRIFPKSESFPSTAKVALMEKLFLIEQEKESSELLNAFKGFFNKGNHWDEQLLFEENLTDKYFLRHGLKDYLNDDNEVPPELLGAYEDLIKCVGGFSPSYYAILIFDGDKMGEWFHGAHLDDQRQLYEFQATLKKLLREFASWATKYLDGEKEERRGRTVYAGGDDFLGLINLHHLYAVLAKMRQKFEEIVNLPLKKEQTKFQIKANSNFSFSAGVAVAHYKQPLTIVLDEARNAEKEAKKSGPNHFAISLMRHSGKATRAVLPFGKKMSEVQTKEDLISNLRALQVIHARLDSEDFSNQFIINLQSEVRFWEKADPRDLFDLEAGRLIARANNIGIGEKDRQEDRRSLNSEMERQVETISGKYDAYPDELSSKELDNTISILGICDFISVVSG